MTGWEHPFFVSNFVVSGFVLRRALSKNTRTPVCVRVCVCAFVCGDFSEFGKSGK